MYNLEHGLLKTVLLICFVQKKLLSAEYTHSIWSLPVNFSSRQNYYMKSEKWVSFMRRLFNRKHEGSFLGDGNITILIWVLGTYMDVCMCKETFNYSILLFVKCTSLKVTIPKQNRVLILIVGILKEKLVNDY